MVFPSFSGTRGRAQAVRALAFSLAAAAAAVSATRIGIGIWTMSAVPAFRAVPDEQRDFVYMLVMSTASLVAALLAILIVTRAAHDAANRLLAVALASAALALALEQSTYVPLLVVGAVTGRYPSYGSFHGGVQLLQAAATSLAFVAALRWTQLFPVPLRPSTIRSYSGRLRGLRRVQIALLRPALLGIGVGGGAFALLALQSRLGIPGTRELTMVSLSLATTALGAANLRCTYDASDEPTRLRMYWVVEALLVAATLLLVSFGVEAAVHLFDSRSAPVHWAHVVLLPAATFALFVLLAFAVLYRGAVDPRLVVRRTAAYGALGVALTTIFVALEGALTSLAVVRFGLPDQVAGLMAGSTVAVFFGPIRNQVERLSSSLVRALMPADALASGTRVSAVIIAADLAGFTPLTQRHETTALTLVSLFHAAARNAAAHHGGRLVKTMGDGVLLSLPTADAAVTAAVQMTRQFRATAAALDIEPLDVRCGIHSGQVVLAPDADVYGDVVNVASRLEAAADDGAILISASTADALTIDGCSFHDRRARQLAGVREPVDSMHIRS